MCVSTVGDSKSIRAVCGWRMLSDDKNDSKLYGGRQWFVQWNEKVPFDQSHLE